MILGRKLENPYSVTNMRKAWDTLVRYESDLLQGMQLTIKATHVYVKFDPQNEEEVLALKRDTIIVYYTYPMDHAIERMGDNYHDPAKPSDMPTYHYASVPVGKDMPAVTHEIVEQLFIPDEYKDGVAGPLGDNEDVIDALVETSLALTGNIEAEYGRLNGNVGGRVSRRRSSWRPAGRVRVFDDVVNNWRGVEGVIVKARRWFTTHEGMVDGNGNYSCNGTFKYDANYSLDWERHHFALREGWLNGANINGPKRRGNWDNDFSGRADKNAFHAKVFMAAYHYYYKDIKGLRRPPLNSFWTTQVRIRCHNVADNNPNGVYQSWNRFLGLGNPIHIYNKQKEPNRPDILMQNIYATTIHELAHAAHWNISSSNYNSCDKKVKESWARGVQWELTRMVWSTYKGGVTFMPSYTQVVVDMIDPNYANQAQSDSINFGIWNDNVTGYTIRQIEDALVGQTTWSGWRDNIKNLYNNATENNLDALFNAWN